MHLIKGTYRGDRDNGVAPSPDAGALVSPSWLPWEAEGYFEELGAHLRAIGLDSAVYSNVVAMAALRIWEVKISTDAMEGEAVYTVVTAAGEAMRRPKPESAQRSEALRHLQSLLVECGLTPASIGKIGGVCVQEPKKNKWAE